MTPCFIANSHFYLTDDDVEDDCSDTETLALYDVSSTGDVPKASQSTSRASGSGTSRPSGSGTSRPSGSGTSRASGSGTSGIQQNAPKSPLYPQRSSPNQSDHSPDKPATCKRSNSPDDDLDDLDDIDRQLELAMEKKQVGFV